MKNKKEHLDRILVDQFGNIISEKNKKIPAWLRPATRSTHDRGQHKIPKNRVEFMPCEIYYDLKLSWETEEEYDEYTDIPFKNPRDFEILYLRYIIHCAEKDIIPDKKAIKYFALVFSEILSGKHPDEALGLRSPGSGQKKYMENYKKRELCRKIDALVNKKNYKVKEAIAEVAQSGQLH